MRNLALEKQARKEIPKLLQEMLGGRVEEHRMDAGPDFLYKFGDYSFLIEFKGAGTLPLVHTAIRQLLEYSSFSKNIIRIVAVPYMGNSARDLCHQNQISWMDLSGNAEIQGPSLLIRVEGKPNLFKAAGRPKNVFAPKSSRITRFLLVNYDKSITRRELALRTGLNESFVGRVVRELAGQNLITEDSEGKVTVMNPDILLDTWQNEYDFRKHRILKGFVPHRSGEAALFDISKKFEASGVSYAATGLAGAWLLSHFATFRLVTFYLKEFPDREQLRVIGFTEQPSGNVWLVFPNDDGVFTDMSTRDQVSCAHPIQIYLDLKGLPERSSEAATTIRSEYLRWNNA